MKKKRKKHSKGEEEKKVNRREERMRKGGGGGEQEGERCSGREISYFGLARNLIRHLISPNQDDLSYSARAFLSWAAANWVSCQTHSL